ncbi:MAG: hypothetical protein IJ070_03330, partial [Firmicutes bacterium]|nr:hypothetical protein [Bacillota bacterium]
MLNIYYGNESIDKERFIFEKIAEKGGRTLIIVPDQFSAQTERNAFFYLGKKSLMDLMVLDFDRLGKKAINAAGVPVPQLIDKYGRHMLLVEILRKEDREETLKTYKGMSSRRTFVAMMNSLISEMKRNEVTPEALEEAASRLDDRKYLKRKLADIIHIYDEYEKSIEGKYLDSEDYITFYGDVIRDSKLVKGAQVWIYGFDTFTPKNMLVISRLLQASECLNLVMDWEDESGNAQDAAFLAGESRRELFALTGYVMSKLEKTGKALGHQVSRIPIQEPVKDNIWTRERGGAETITLAKCSGLYNEAESAAAYITWLVRDEGYRYGDIAVICNDMTGLGAILERTLRRWQIPSFMDRKRDVLHHPAVRFILALMDIAAEGYRPEQIITLIKSGLMGFDAEDADALENYVYRFRIRGSRWKEAFTRKTDETSEDLDKLNRMRQMIVASTEGARESLGRRNSAGEKIRGLYKYLTEDLEIEQRLESIMDGQEDAGFMEAASETAQSWNVICTIFDQIVEVTGDKGISNRELKELLLSGLEEMEIGLVPVSSDSVIIGTLQR